MSDDIFCKIISGQVSAEFVYRDEDVVVFKDAHPKAPVHLLVVPTAHYVTIGDVPETRAGLLGNMLQIAHRVAVEQGLAGGYRLVINEGQDAHKMVGHLHLHVMGGRSLGPKME